MATLLRYPPKTGVFHVKFRLGGRQFKYSLKHDNETRANESLAKVERVLQELAEGRTVLPEGADVVEFVKTDGGRLKKLDPQKKQLALKDLFAIYREKLTVGSKTARTATLHQIHGRHLVRVLGNKPLIALTRPGVLQAYVDTRIREKFRERPIKPQTVVKELKTLFSVWRWATSNGHTNIPCPPNLRGGLTFPREVERPRFQTLVEIKKQIERGHLSENEQDAMWECLFIDAKQTDEVLDFFEKNAEPWVYLAVLFVGHTGARRSEMVRAEVSDFDFENGVVKIRERKRAGGALTYRQVPMSDRLRKAFEGEFRKGTGRFAVPVDPERAVEMLADDAGPDAVEGFVAVASALATRAFRSTVDGTKWNVLHGYHVFRHSFISNLARAGIDQRVIDEFVGHSSEAMRRRYRHLFPEQRKDAIKSIFG